jgi:hypothetical protein
VRRPTVRTSLTVINLTFATIFLAFALFSLSSVRAVNDETAAIAKNWLPSVSVVRNMQFELEKMRLAYANHIMSISDEGSLPRKVRLPDRGRN